jgi:hypothetical protein
MMARAEAAEAKGGTKPHRERMRQWRKRAEQAGLKRVEVLVPEANVDELKAYAADLREGAQSEKRREMRKLVQQAYDRHRAQCLDNIDIDPDNADFADAAIVAAALMNRGSGDAFKLGRRIKQIAR